jgi:hypothetical protein
MTASQMQMCSCEICIDEHNIHKAFIKWQVATLKDFKQELANHPDKTSDEYKLVEETMKEFVADIFPDGEGG